MVDTVAQWATAVGAGFVAFQLWQTQRALRATFERTFVERYERIIANVPLTAVLEGELPETTPDAEREVIERAFFDYFELCEEEMYYRKLGRVSRRTWVDWWEGMALHFRNPAFGSALDKLVDRSASTEQAPGRADTRGRPTRFHHVREARARAKSDQVYDPVQGRLRRFRRQ